MVRVDRDIRKKVETFVCEACGFRYGDEKTAKECEVWCATHNSCNLNIIKRAIGQIEINYEAKQE